MKHKRNLLAWLKKHRAAIFWGTSSSIVVILLGLYVIGGIVTDNVIRRTTLYDVPTLDIKIEAVPAPLSGYLVDKVDAARNVIGVMIENSLEARPQSGLDSAEVVFEAIAEGGITRFVAFYQAEQPSRLGPVRSVRPHYNDWVMSFDASIAHAGGSSQGLAEIRSFGIKDLDQFANGGFYYRDSGRYAPHNLYTSISELNQLQKIKGYNKSTFTPWKYADGETAEKVTASSIAATISSGLFNISYEYDSNINEYLRSEGGAPHIDANTDGQISVDNVIIMEVSYSVDGSGYYHYNLVGSGNAHLFNNGTYQKVKWQRSSRTASFRFTKDGKDVTLNRGQTWVTAIRPGNSVEVTP